MDNNPEIKINFIRHSEHQDDSDESKLTFQGVEEASKLAHYLCINKEQALGISPSILRSVLTTFAVISPQSSVEFIDELDKISRHRILIDDNLQYSNPDIHPIFAERLYEAFKNKNVFKFLVLESDTFNSEDYSLITSYTSMVRFLSKLILKYAKIFPSWERISEQKEDKVLYRVVCGKEYFYPCFRAEMTKKILGDEEFAKFLDWYTSNIEYKDSSRLEIAEISIQVHENNKVVAYLKDGYGILEIPINELEQVLTQKIILLKV